MGLGSKALSQGIGRSLRLWALRTSRALGLAPTTVGTALGAIAVLLVHRLQAGRGEGSLMAARPVDATLPRPQAQGTKPESAVRPAA